MKETDGRDDRIRKLFSRLPRVKAPQGFEERVARAVAGGRPGRSGFPARLRAFAIPGMAALLVGVISYFVYHDRTDTDPELSIPTADTVAVQPGPVGTDIPSQDEHVSPMPAPLEPETTQPSAPGRMSRPKSRFAPPQVMMGEPTADTAAAAANPVEQRDSLTIRDSLAMRDSLDRLDSLARRDSAGVDSPRALPDSLRERPDIPKRE
jgi:hypothetical protein